MIIDLDYDSAQRIHTAVLISDYKEMVGYIKADKEQIELKGASEYLKERLKDRKKIAKALKVLIKYTCTPTEVDELFPQKGKFEIDEI